MDADRLSALHAYYGSLSDEALLAEAGRGRDAFVPEAWTVVSKQIELRAIRNTRPVRHRLNRVSRAAAAGTEFSQPSRVDRFAARIDALPPTIRPAAYGALFIVFFAMARGAWPVLPIVVVYILATSAEPWASLMSVVGIAILAMAGGALSGLAYGLVGRHVQTTLRGGYYLTGVLTLAPYMFVLPFIARLFDGVPFWQRPSGREIVTSSVMTLLFGLVLGRTWFGPDDEGKPTERAT